MMEEWRWYENHNLAVDGNGCGGGGRYPGCTQEEKAGDWLNLRIILSWACCYHFTSSPSDPEC